MLIIFYGYPLLIAASNWLLMERPKQIKTADSLKSDVVVLIPARNEAHNLKHLIPCLTAKEPNLRIYVFDDESTDDTAKVARELGAIVIQPSEPLPTGWTGKNRACDQLARAAIEDSEAHWMVFLDADTRTNPDFIGICRGIANNSPSSVGVYSGFGRLNPGSFLEPLFLAWVPYILLASNPFGIVSRTGIGHNQFTNGQFTLWRKTAYQEIWPNETLKGKILEDVQIGRLLKTKKIGLRVVDLSRFFSVKMYNNPKEAFDGLSKNSYEIAGSAIGSIGVAVFLLLIGFAWLAGGHLWWLPLILLWISGLFVFANVRMNIILATTMPINMLIGACTVMRSIVWHKTGKVQWKGRTYPKS